MSDTIHSILNVLGEHEISYFLNNKAVLSAKGEINAKSSGSVYFSIPVPQEIKAKLETAFNLDLSTLDHIPMRWIKGDTLPHIDKGANAFQNTYLAYLTDSVGEFVVGDETYPITQGSAFIFNEGLSHKTQNTGAVPRLLLGPMSEEGFAVGALPTFGGPGGTNIYVRDNAGTIEYSFNQTDWYDIPSWPCNVVNTDTSAGVLTVVFTTDITLDDSSNYFICDSSHIQFGTTTLNTDGTRPIITIDGVTGYPGLIKNGEDGSNGYSNIYVYNLEVDAANGSTLIENDGMNIAGGWIGQSYFGYNSLNNYIINCSSSGNISTKAGGILGQYAGRRNDEATALTIIGCSSSGTIGGSAGGIIGSDAAYNGGTVTCLSCWSAGTIGTNGGGILGESAGANTGILTVTNCYSEGYINAGAGGICGALSTAAIANCYSTGEIDLQAGGICGGSATNTNITNCYSTGAIGNQAGGICGLGPTNVTISNCYTTGTVTGGQGYIIGGSATVPASCFSEANSGTPGSWITDNTTNILTGVPASQPGVGTTWISTETDIPFELTNMGYTPYSTTNIAANTLVRVGTASVNVGRSTSAGIKTGSYQIIAKSGGNSGSYGTITIDASTGAISTTSSTAPGTYVLFIYSTGSYNVTQYTLTVNNNTAEVTCCDIPMNLNRIDYAARNAAVAGNVILGYVNARPANAVRLPMSSSDLLKIQIAKNARWH